MDFANIKKGVILMIKDRPCKVIDMAISQPGKHGGAKNTVTGLDILNDKKCKETFNHHSHIIVPEVVRNVYNLMYIGDENYLSLIDNNSIERGDVILTEDKVSKKIKNLYKQDKSILVTLIDVTFNENTYCRLINAEVDKS